MVLTAEEILATIFRLGMVIIYGYIWLYFHKRYKQSMEKGFKNNFFLGFLIIFGILIVFSLLYGLYEVYFWNLNSLEGVFDVAQHFTWANKTTLEAQGYPPLVVLMCNQYRPLYISFYAILNFVMASLVFPLEQAVGFKKTPFTKFMVAAGCAIFLLFIRVIALSYIGVALVVIGFTGFGLGIILNVLVNLKLFKDSTGAIRRRCLFAICAFVFLALGLYASMEVNFVAAFVPGASYRWDVIVGSIFQIISVIFYRLGFAQEGLSE
jgi:hypothetical protein